MLIPKAANLNLVINRNEKKIQILMSSSSPDELAFFRSLHSEPLKGERKGEYSIRLNLQYRLISSIEQDNQLGFEVLVIQEISKHYEK
ncbi:MAG: type II toxin-antitoxin system RelE/ParE family toxin [Bacteroidota bacterium]|nr:type II toxin-antitoxin system RelE/ParE family toxin [Bacteroidota bacterium]